MRIILLNYKTINVQLVGDFYFGIITAFYKNRLKNKYDER